MLPSKPLVIVIFMNNIYILCVCLVLIPLFAAADEAELQRQCAPWRVEIPDTGNLDVDTAYTDGLLWKIVKDNRVNYLFGSMHSRDPRVAVVPPRVRLAMQSTDIYLSEVDQGMEANQVFLDAMTMEEGKSLADHLHPELAGLLVYKAGKYGIEAKRVLQLQPWAAFSLIGRPRPTRGLTLDQVLMNYAIRQNHEVHALESMQELLGSLQSIPMDVQIEILSDTLCNHEQILESIREQVNLYMRADLEAIVRMNAKPHRDEQVHQRFMKIMVEDRSRRMLQRLLPWFEQGGSFATIGATHLHGERGLLNLLVERGYRVENVF